VKVLFDTNVILDLILERHPFHASAAALVAKVERREVVGVLGATTLTTIHYLVAKAVGSEKARSATQGLLGVFQIAPVDHGVLENAARSPIKDFEDAVLHEAGKGWGVDALVTRDPEDFRSGNLPVFSPRQLQRDFDAAQEEA
jgi:predicted nucleic acid-binding protein